GIWPADAGASHGPAPSAGFSRRASWSEHPQPACGWILSAFGFPGIDSRRFGEGWVHLYGESFFRGIASEIAKCANDLCWLYDAGEQFARSNDVNSERLLHRQQI